MRNIVRIACLLAIIGVTPAYALDQIGQYVPQAEKVGHGRLSVMFWDVYDASLYAPNGKWDKSAPFALQLFYLRDIPGKKIADRSIEEIRNQGFQDEVRLADWHAQMIRIFPDVDKNTSLTGIYTDTGGTIFLSGSKEIGRINDPVFGKYFFDIWLSEKTSAPDLRQKLLGQS
jgi:hypothetical protein